MVDGIILLSARLKMRLLCFFLGSSLLQSVFVLLILCNAKQVFLENQKCWSLYLSTHYWDRGIEEEGEDKKSPAYSGIGARDLLIMRWVLNHSATTAALQSARWVWTLPRFNRKPWFVFFSLHPSFRSF